MDPEHQLLFFFSAIGAFNGLFLSIYFAFFVKHRNRANYFLSALMLVLSIRIIKSVFLFFYPFISELFIHIGLSACALIGPFLYLYVKNTTTRKNYRNRYWLYHIVPTVLVMVIIEYLYPYRQHRGFWNFFGFNFLYTQWIVYVILSGIVIKSAFATLVKKGKKMTDEEIWLISLVAGVAIIWAAYRTTEYTSYIVGALSFSFVFYLILLLWFFKRRKTTPFFFAEQTKYANKKIETGEATEILSRLNILFEQKESYKNPNLKLADVADQLDMPSHHLSQCLNDNLGRGFSAFINEYRVKEAEKMLATDHHLTVEAIGYECGFSSKSTFYSAFKNLKGTTPAKYKKIYT
ncbi:AraC family transcriptional regulator [Sinomicrobium weinanense]|uniref:AraC family transcriptional regulator n=1 Tax=Sinomicrobium weinanense TaxID=2842200 RepID=A0A926JV09_9FLAO|nr:helix-turn-helix domain-containing protein [Sinomicrobium weinanense]MBC9798073.1 AraC family transcriptional regulator [Sinomicrobium weinanense]MBU3122514.1 helix-turn-helix domain-containing protein [Sinomicrobium weinanense]